MRSFLFLFSYNFAQYSIESFSISPSQLNFRSPAVPLSQYPTRIWVWFCAEARVMGQLDLCPLILSCPSGLYELGVVVSGRVYKRTFDLENMMNARAYFESFCQSLNRKNLDFAVSEARWMADSFVNCFGNNPIIISLFSSLRLMHILFKTARWMANRPSSLWPLCRNPQLAPTILCS